MIKIDLHIHSKASEYKESRGQVDQSDADHIDVLLEKLNSNQVNMFSITDHNRFDSNLYKKIDEELSKHKYPHVQSLLAGVEFDVCFEEGYDPCHVIVIFDAKNDEEKYQRIEKSINADLLERPNDYYSKDRFEGILRNIGLPVILIAHQKCDLGKKRNANRSLSASASNSDELIYGGYISALEFSRPNQEGIVKYNLREANQIAPLISGSDCHDWNCYPNKDSRDKTKGKRLTQVEILPTFKGLHMAITSPKTRIEPKAHSCSKPIKSFWENDREHLLKNGIIAVVGENGSGKSTILEFLYDITNGKKPDYQRTLKKANGFRLIGNTEKAEKKIIRQGDIVQQFNKDQLFTDDYFEEVDFSIFKNNYIEHSKKLKKAIQSRIDYSEKLEKLNEKEWDLKEDSNKGTFWVTVEIPGNFSNIENKHVIPFKKLELILNKILELKTDEYFKEFGKSIDEIIKIFMEMFEKIEKRKDKISKEIQIKNLLEAVISSYTNELNDVRSSEEQETEEIRKKRQSFIDCVVETARAKSAICAFPSPPPTVSGSSTKPKRGFSFTRIAEFHKQDVYKSFLRCMFNQNYQDIDKLKEIETKGKFQDAVTGCTDYATLNEYYEKNLNSF